MASLLIILLAGVAQAQRPTAATHIVRPGETLGLIAQSYGVDLYTLASANNIGNAHLIHSWQELTIPSLGGEQSMVKPARATHIVRRGETLGTIARDYGVSLFDLQAQNRIWTWIIYVGQELEIPAGGELIAAASSPANPDESPPPPARNEASGVKHKVRVGETLGTIARDYGVALTELQALNNIWTWIIYVGQELEIPAGGELIVAPNEPAKPDERPAPPELIEASGLKHKVHYGETLGAIARDFGVSLTELQALNNIWTWLIYVGQELEIPAGGTLPEVPDAPSEAAPPIQSMEVSTPVQHPAPAPLADTHTVQRGETLFRIAKTYGVELDALIRANGIADATKIHTGLVLRVRNLDAFSPPQPASASNATPAPAPQPAADRKRYVVQRGEFLSQIGARFGMSWLAIAAVNGLQDPDNLKVGTVLLIPTAEEAAKYGPVLPTYSDPGARVGVGREFVVVLGTQMAYAYEDGVLKRSARISSGLPDTPTVKGEFRIRRKVRSQRMRGEDYDLDNVEWVMYFYAGYAFHGTWWHSNFGRPMSRGCVNMTNGDAKWFYEFGSIGTPVYVRD